METYFFDYETRSPLDLKKVGAARYAESCDILMFGVAAEQGEAHLWDSCELESAESQRALSMLRRAFEPGNKVVVHNVGFESPVTLFQSEKTLGVPAPLVTNWMCSAAMCRIAGVPASLAGAGTALALPQQKDTMGKALIELFSIRGLTPDSKREWSSVEKWVRAHSTSPSVEAVAMQLTEERLKKGGIAKKWLTRAAEVVAGCYGHGDTEVFTHEGTTYTLAEAWQLFRKYCRQDVLAQRELYYALKSFEPEGWVLDAFHADLAMNLRGVPVDVTAARAATVAVEEGLRPIRAACTALTGLEAISGSSFQAWLDARGYQSCFEKNVPHNPTSRALALSRLKPALVDAARAAITAGEPIPTLATFLLLNTLPEIEAVFGKCDVKALAYRLGYAQLFDSGKGLTADEREEALTYLNNLTELTNDQKLLRKVLTYVDTVSYAALKKFGTMCDRVNTDGRLRGEFVFYGASTGRASSQGVQVHNIKRPVKALQAAAHGVTEALHQGCTDLDDVLALYGVDPADKFETLACAVRHMFREPDGLMIGADFANIEARIQPWFVGEEWVLDYVRAKRDLYLAMAADIVNEPEDELIARYKSGDLEAADFRQLGKVAELSAQYQCGARRLMKTAAAAPYKIVKPLIFWADVIAKYRTKHAALATSWQLLNDAAVDALMLGKEVRVLKSVFRRERLANATYLTIELASGRKLFYRDALCAWTKTRCEDDERGPTEVLADAHAQIDVAAARKLDEADATAVRRRREELGDDSAKPHIYYTVSRAVMYRRPEKAGVRTVNLFGGLILENIVQATAADFLWTAMVALTKAGWPMTMQVHDELQGPARVLTADQVAEIMRQVPAWAEGLPLGAEAAEALYYRK